MLYCAQILATGFSGLIAAGVFAGLDGVNGIAGWRWLFIMYVVRLQTASIFANSPSEGAVTAFVAIFGFCLLPNTPLTTSWLTPEERQMAHDRMERDRVGDSGEKVSMMEGLRQACKDKRTWLFCLMQNFHLSACSFNSFFPT